MKEQAWRMGIQQRVLPAYRVPFFDLLAQTYQGKVSIFFGTARSHEMLETNALPQIASYKKGRNLHLFAGQFYLCWQLGLLEWLQEWQPHVLIMEANPRYPLSWKAIRWMKKQKGKVIGWGLGSSISKDFFGYLRAHERSRFIRQFDALITYSKQGAEEYQRLGFPKERIFVAPNAVTRKPTDPPPRRPGRYEFNQPNVLFVGRLQERKRVDALINACASLPPELQPQLHIVGDGPARCKLEQLAQENYAQTKFYGAVHGKELEALFYKADLFVLPGTGGLAVQEAMRYALPVIVGQADGTQSDLVQAENGWVLERGGVVELKNKMIEALSDLAALRAKGVASFNIVRDEANLEKMAVAFQAAINAVMENP